VRTAILGKVSFYTPARIEGEGADAKPHGKHNPARKKVFCPYCRAILGDLGQGEWAPAGSKSLFGSGSVPETVDCPKCAKPSILPTDGVPPAK
jgi:hypothetical protein